MSISLSGHCPDLHIGGDYILMVCFCNSRMCFLVFFSEPAKLSNLAIDYEYSSPQV